MASVAIILAAGCMGNSQRMRSVGDHGDGAAHRRRRKKQTLYDECARVPFIVSGAGVLNRGTVDGTHLVSAIDIAPSILDYAGVERPAHLEGQSLRPLVETGSWQDHPYVVTETLFNKGTTVPGWAGRMVRTSRSNTFCTTTEKVVSSCLICRSTRLRCVI